jgi:acyl carrier protein
MTENHHLRGRIITVVSHVFGLPREAVERGIGPEQVDGWDSEKHVQLVVALEDQFGVMFEAEEVPELTSLEQMEAIIARHG